MPFRATLSAAGTRDFDGDPLTYVWSVEPEGGGSPRVFRRADVTVPFGRPGVYIATLTVTDNHGAEGRQLVTIVAGNDVPAVQVKVAGNETFFFPDQPLEYIVEVSDREDGTLASGRIPLGGSRSGSTTSVRDSTSRRYAGPTRPSIRPRGSPSRGR